MGLIVSKFLALFLGLVNAWILLNWAFRGVEPSKLLVAAWGVVFTIDQLRNYSLFSDFEQFLKEQKNERKSS